MLIFTVVALYLLVNVAFFYFFTFRLTLWDLIYVVLLEYIALGLTYDMAELLLALVAPRCDPPHCDGLMTRPRIALLCCTCDDVDIGVLRNLRNQTYENLEVFILDDSQSNNSRSLVDSVGLTVIRRCNRSGYKAGNLNNWLSRYSLPFPYFVVADADSILPDSFVEQMVCYAEHPENANVAIFESYIQAWNTGNRFAHLQNVMAPLYRRLKSRLDNRAGTNLSAGHNNLYRTDVVRNVGGFMENYMAEDYATSAQILKWGKWLCKTVPITSYERLPENLSEYSRREARWAFQTFQLLSFNTSGLSLNLRLKLLMALHHHSTRVVASIAMLFLILFTLYLGEFAFTQAINGDNELRTRSSVIVFWTILLAGPTILRGFLVCREGVSIKDYVVSIVFHSALFAATIWPVVRRLATLVTTDRVGFNVTGTAPVPSLLHIMRSGSIGFVLIWATLLAVLFSPFLSEFNLIWILPATFSPLVIHYTQKSFK